MATLPHYYVHTPKLIAEPGGLSGHHSPAGDGKPSLGSDVPTSPSPAGPHPFACTPCRFDRCDSCLGNGCPCPSQTDAESCAVAGVLAVAWEGGKP